MKGHLSMCQSPDAAALLEVTEVVKEDAMDRVS